MRTALLISTIVGLAVLPGAALAASPGCPAGEKPEGERLTLQQLRSKLVEQGWRIRSGEVGERCGEFYAIDGNGKRADLFTDASSGKIVFAASDADARSSGRERDERRGGASREKVERGGEDTDGDDR